MDNVYVNHDPDFSSGKSKSHSTYPVGLSDYLQITVVESLLSFRKAGGDNARAVFSEATPDFRQSAALHNVSIE
jgi:hypothetical protein